MPHTPATALAVASLAVLVFACGNGEMHPGDAEASSSSPEETSRPRNERPLPGFEGRMLDGQRRPISDFLGKRLLLYFFNPEVSAIEPATRAVATVARERRDYNFEIVGVGIGSDHEKLRAFADRFDLDFPIYDDSNGRITRIFRLQVPGALYGVDAEGYLQFGMGVGSADVDDAGSMIEARLREVLRLPTPGEEVSGRLETRPKAPLFEAEQLDGDGTFRLADHAGEPLVLIFFLHTCPHCHHALEYLREELAKLPEDARPALYGISAQDKPAAVRGVLREKGLDFFPVLLDPGNEIFNRYGVFGGVPVVVLIDSQGRIAFRSTPGWPVAQEPALVRMYLHKIAGQPVPMLLNPHGYTGNEVCGVCHESETATWRFTSHAFAFDTLVKHGADRDAECVSCHVVGFGKPGGYAISEHQPYLEDVGCESCHGPGGPHVTLPDEKPAGDYESTCRTCHDPKHSLGFEYASFLPKVSHAAIAARTPEERAALLASHDAFREVLPTNASMVGSEACRGCHPSEYATWLESGHAHAVETLEAKGEAGNADCLRCHTTGYGRKGGFPKGAAPGAHPDLARVGCESCHGPGGNHVKEGVRKLGSIVSLGDKCDSCVILQICGSCHDDANDPGFEFEVVEKIEQQRHGTIEAGTGRSLDGAARGDEAERPEVALGRAFSALDERG